MNAKEIEDCDDDSGGEIEKVEPSRNSLVSKTARKLWRAPGTIMIWCVRGYQLTLSRLIGPVCRFQPSCSQYFILAVKKYGAVRGALKGAWRICRCHPFCKGGHDPP